MFLTKISQHKMILAAVVAVLFGLMVAAPAWGLCDTSVDPLCRNVNLNIQQDADFMQVASNIINIALSLLGLLTVVIVLIGGFKWMTAGGSEDKVAEARKLIVSGIIGLAIVLSAWAISTFVLDALLGALS